MKIDKDTIIEKVCHYRPCFDANLTCRCPYIWAGWWLITIGCCDWWDWREWEFDISFMPD